MGRTIARNLDFTTRVELVFDVASASEGKARAVSEGEGQLVRRRQEEKKATYTLIHCTWKG